MTITIKDYHHNEQTFDLDDIIGAKYNEDKNKSYRGCTTTAYYPPVYFIFLKDDRKLTIHIDDVDNCQELRNKLMTVSTMIKN